MIETQDLYGNKYNIKSCTVLDIPKHYELVSSFIPENDKETYIECMNKSVEAGTAFALEDDSCFLYYLNYKKCLAHGCAIYGKGNPSKMIALLMGIFWKIDTNTFKLDFALHSTSFIEEYKSIITLVSLKRRNQDPKRPLVVRIDELKNKLKPLAESRGIIWQP